MYSLTSSHLNMTWDRKFFLDYVFIMSREYKTNYKCIIPVSETIQFQYHMQPHTREHPGPSPILKGIIEHPTLYFHDGKTNLGENVWWLLRFNNSDSWEGEHKLLPFPEDLINIFNSVKIRAFEGYIYMTNGHFHNVFYLTISIAYLKIIPIFTKSGQVEAPIHLQLAILTKKLVLEHQSF